MPGHRLFRLEHHIYKKGIFIEEPKLGIMLRTETSPVQLLPDLPEYLKDLFVRTETQVRQFRHSLRQYNVAFAFMSLGCDIISAEERNANSNFSLRRPFENKILKPVTLKAYLYLQNLISQCLKKYLND
ncbi:hypothetical protein BCV71DRAFT_233489 [Rhizopus microsporus]|uniref:Uncharacterized protein n=1 Tax=Rhizopus microsporus TaxID=58291 RepID=A0A1X0S736_RHIZD|nr:hypothetical protein BCV71DRAFT_233489 [Rhizopus microsporus]